MSQLKYFNSVSGEWEPTIVGANGEKGDTGEPGPGVAAGGTEGQILSKVDGTDYNTEWSSSIDGNVVSLQHKRNTHAGWISENPILEAGEVGFETDTGLSKTGDGTKTWSALSWDSIAHSKQYVKAGESISKGQAVYVSGSDGTDMIVSKASNASEATSSKTFGLMNGTTSSGSYNTVVTEGILGGLDTSAATAGDAVWLGTSGNLIYGLSNKPSAPAHLVFIGIVEAAHASAGRIYVKVQNGFELDELHDVSITSPAAGEIIARNSANTLWENKTLAEAGVSAAGHTHDDRYYTETETNTLLSGKADTSHTHAASAITSGTLDYARMPAGTVLQVVTNRYAGRPGIGYNGATIISYLNTVIYPKSANSLLMADFTISGEANYNAVFRAYRDGGLITNSGYWGYNQEDGSSYSGIAVVPYDGDLASTPFTMNVRYFVPSYSTAGTTLQVSIQTTENQNGALYLNRTYNSGGATAYENMVSYVTITEIAQ